MGEIGNTRVYSKDEILTWAKERSEPRVWTFRVIGAFVRQFLGDLSHSFLWELFCLAFYFTFGLTSLIVSWTSLPPLSQWSRSFGQLVPIFSLLFFLTPAYDKYKGHAIGARRKWKKEVQQGTYVEVKSGTKTISFSEVPNFNLDDYRVVEKVSRGLWHRKIISSDPMPVIKVDVFSPRLSDSSLHSAAPRGQVSIAEERSSPRRRSCSPRRVRRSSTHSLQKEDEGGASLRPGPSTDRDTSNQPNGQEAGDSEEGLEHTEGVTPAHERSNEKDSNNLVRPNASADARSSLEYDSTSSGWSTDTSRHVRPMSITDYQRSEASLGSIERRMTPGSFERHRNLYLQLSDIKGDLWVETITIVTILGFLYLQLLGVFFGGAFAGWIVGPKAGAWTFVSTVVSASVGTIQFSSSIGVHIVSVSTLLMTSTIMTQQEQQQANWHALVAATVAANTAASALSGVAVTGTFDG